MEAKREVKDSEAEKHPKCLGRYVGTDKRALAAAKAARARLIRKTTAELLDAFECLCDSRRDLAASIRAILEDVL